MSTVSSASAADNTGPSYLSQLLSQSTSPLLSGGFSSSQVQSILSDAPAKDVITISEQALQLSNLSTLFGDSTSTESTTDPNEVLTNLLSTLYSASSTAQTSSSSTSVQVSAVDNALQQQATLLGTL